MHMWYSKYDKGNLIKDTAQGKTSTFVQHRNNLDNVLTTSMSRTKFRMYSQTVCLDFVKEDSVAFILLKIMKVSIFSVFVKQNLNN